MPGGGERLSKDLTAAEFRQFRDYIHHHSGIYLEESKTDSLRISLLARATRIDSPGWDAYFEVLARDEKEFRELMSLITINETSFFRFPGQFDALRTTVLPQIAEARGGDNRTLRMWSAGCSTGEEPYSIAMTFLDSGLASGGWRGEVYGTDVSTKALGVAKAGVYPARAVATLPDDVVRRHFVAADDSYRVGSPARGIVDFGYHNLIKEPYPLALMGNWDVIFCRNVTIYFKLESTRRVVQNLHNSLNDGGYLFIGHSETLTTISDRFDPVEIGGVFLYQKASTRRIHPVPTLPVRERRTGRSARTVPSPATATRSARSARQLDSEPDAAVLASVQARDDTDARLVAAHLFADAGDYDSALEECQRALEVNPLLPGARYLLGVIHQRQGDLVRAISELKKTIYIDPEYVLAHLNLGNIYKADGRFVDACREYENALRALDKNPEGEWTLFLGGWTADVVVRTCERSLLECRKATGIA
jgi:chemotaxis protein methyltransferase CheR